MPTATFQLERYVRKHERFPFDWTTCQGTARALENFRRQHFTEDEAGKIDHRPNFGGRSFPGRQLRRCPAAEVRRRERPA